MSECFLPIEIFVACDPKRSDTLAGGGRRGGGDERGFPGLGVVKKGLMEVKAGSLSNKDCASKLNLRIMTTSLRIFSPH